MILEDLNLHQANGVEEYILTEIESVLAIGNIEKKIVAILGAVALCNCYTLGWERVGDFNTQTEFLKEVFLAVADEGQALLKLNSAKESLLADLYLWWVNHFPHEEDPKL